MDLDAIVHDMVSAMMAQTHSRLVEVDDLVLALERRFPDLSEAESTASVVRDVEQQGGTIAWIGHA